MAAKLLMGIDLDVFQKARLRFMWWTPDCIDTSGFSTGKTIVDFVYIQLRCMLLPDHNALVYYQTFQVMKDSYFPYYSRIHHPLFQAQLGKIDKEGNEKTKDSYKDPACWKVFYKNESVCQMPAPGFLQNNKTQASRRTNTLLIDEFTKAESMSSKGGSGIDEQLIGRTTRPSWTQLHPIWCNHRTFTATAEDSAHPSYKRIREFEKAIRRGSPNHALFAFSFKDWSDFECPQGNGKTWKQVYRVDTTIKEMKRQYTRHKYLQEAMGIWSKEGRGLYASELLAGAIERGMDRKLVPAISRVDDTIEGERFYFAGVDPAPAQGSKSDDGAVIIGRAMINKDSSREGLRSFDNPADWIFDLIYARKVRGASMRQWSGIIHDLHRRFSLTKIMLDQGPGGGGGLLRVELNKTRQLINGQEIECKPILTPEDTTAMVGDFILSMFWHSDRSLQALWPDCSRGGDVVKDYAHSSFIAALTYGSIGIPPLNAVGSKQATWPKEKNEALELISKLLPSQLSSIRVATINNGETLALTARNARQFITSAHDDFVSAALMAYAGFLVWLKSSELWIAATKEDSDLCD